MVIDTYTPTIAATYSEGGVTLISLIGGYFYREGTYANGHMIAEGDNLPADKGERFTDDR